MPHCCDLSAAVIHGDAPISNPMALREDRGDPNRLELFFKFKFECRKRLALSKKYNVMVWSLSSQSDLACLDKNWFFPHKQLKR